MTNRSGEFILLPWQGGCRVVSLDFVKTYLATNLVSASTSIGRSQGVLLAGTHTPEDLGRIRLDMFRVVVESAELGLESTHRQARAIPIGLDAATTAQIQAELHTLQRMFDSDLLNVRFLYLTPDQNRWFDKTALDLLGPQCCERFSSMIPDADEAIKCIAMERYTACVFHLTRMMEAGIRALAKTLNYTMEDNNSGKVIREFQNQIMNRNDQIEPWKSNGDLIEEIGYDLRAINKAYRNRVAHLEASYSPERTAEFMTVVPMFAKHLATRLDEKGVFYPAPSNPV